MEEKRYLKRKEKAFNDGNREQLGICCKNLGDYYNEQGRYEEAAREYQQEAEIFEKMSKTLEMAKAHRMIGEMFMLLSKFDNAKLHINIYLKNVKKVQNKVEEQRAFATLGRAHLLHGQSASDTSSSVALSELTQAEKAFLKSLLLVKELTGQISKLEQLDMQARCYLNIGVVKEHMSNFEDSITYIEKAIKICKSHDLFELTHLCYISMSLLYHCKKNNAISALRYCNLALEVAKRLPNKVQKICETLVTKAEILVKEGDFASAKQILTKAYKKNTPNENDQKTIDKMLRIVVTICRALDDLVTTNSSDYGKCKQLYERVGDACCQLQNYDKALDYYQKMLESATMNGENGKDLVPIYVSLYQTYKDSKQYDKALEYLWQEYEINKDEATEAFTTLCSIAEICEMQDQSFWTINDIYQKAKSHIERSAADSDNNGNGDENAVCKANVRNKLYRIVYARLKKIQEKHKMSILLEELEQEVRAKGNISEYRIEFENLETDGEDTDEGNYDSDGDSQNTPELGADICLEDLTDSDTSDLDETDKQRPHRATRGQRCLTIKRNNKGETPLHQACIAGNLELIRRLLDQGHVVNVRDHAGWLPLHEACNHGFREIAALLLERGAAVAINDKGGTSCDGITPLYDACANGYLDVIELLLERGADATVKTDFGETCVDGLDKWRRSAKLNTGEQAHYIQIRAMLSRPLSRTGVVQRAKPLTNAHVTQPDLIESNYNENSSSDDDDKNVPQETQIYPYKQDTAKWTKSKKESPKKPTAGLEYRTVIEQLKHPNHPHLIVEDNASSSMHGLPSTSSALKSKRTALLNANEIDDESWIIDDIGPEKKKRRYHSVFPAISPHKATTNPLDRRSTSKENLQNFGYIGQEEREGNNSLDNEHLTWLSEHDVDSNSSNISEKGNAPSSSLLRSKQFKRSKNICSLSMSTRVKSGTAKFRKHQTSLLESGFCRFLNKSSNENDDFNAQLRNSHCTEPDSTTTTTPTAISPGKTFPLAMEVVQASQTAFGKTTVSFKIKIEDEMLLVPIERRKLQDVNIRWLAEEAARRYYNLIGLRPTLRLKTSDGFAYEDNDPVNVAIDQNVISATVLEWKITPILQRYEEMCHQLNRTVDAAVQCALERAQATNSLQLEDLWLQAKHIEPLFKALLHQSTLRVLSLANNFIQNEGCRLLAKSLSTLSQLKCLNLKSNFITCDGLDVLFATTTTKNANVVLNELEELNLSRNPLGNGCLKILERFCSKSSYIDENTSCSGNSGGVGFVTQGRTGGVTTNALRKLFLSQCSLTHLYDYDLNYYELDEFDISFNRLPFESMRKLFNKLNASRLQAINVAYNSDCLQNGNNDDDDHDASNGLLCELIVEFFESGTCEKFKRITLCGCHLSDSNVYRIVQCVSKASALELIDLSDNPKLSGNALQFIIDELPNLRKLVATNCIRLIDQQRIEALTNCQQLPNLFSLTLGECHVRTSSDVNYNVNDSGTRTSGDGPYNQTVQRLESIWKSHWGDKSKTISYDNNVIFYTIEKDVL